MNECVLCGESEGLMRHIKHSKYGMVIVCQSHPVPEKERNENTNS